MCFGGPSVRSTPAPVTATPSDPVVLASVERERRRQGALQGRTVLTSGQGVIATTPTAPKTLLGQ